MEAILKMFPRMASGKAKINRIVPL